jgi:hypothetical protein
MTAVMLSRVIRYVREAYIACAFGAGGVVDAYVAALHFAELAELHRRRWNRVNHFKSRRFFQPGEGSAVRTTGRSPSHGRTDPWDDSG